MKWAITSKDVSYQPIFVRHNHLFDWSMIDNNSLRGKEESVSEQRLFNLCISCDLFILCIEKKRQACDWFVKLFSVLNTDMITDRTGLHEVL